MKLRLGSSIICYYIVTTLCLVWISAGVSDANQCSCYTFGWITNSWSNSREQCRTRGGDLVSMETIEEWQFINLQIQNRTVYNNEWWIGLEKRDGKWKWVSKQPITYNNWQPGEPRGVNDKCVVMAKNYPPNTYGLFDNARCDLSRGWICEYKIYAETLCSNNEVKWCYNRVSPTVMTVSKTDPEATTTTTTTSDFDISTRLRQTTAATSNVATDSAKNTPYNTKPTQHTRITHQQKTTPLQEHEERDPITSDPHKLTNIDCLPYPLLVTAVFVSVLGGLTVLATVAFFLVPFVLKKNRSSIV